MPRTVTVEITTTVTLDVERYADEYGITAPDGAPAILPALVAEDVRNYLSGVEAPDLLPPSWFYLRTTDATSLTARVRT